MSITVNVNGQLKELVALYYNDNGTIRELKEVYTNTGTAIKSLFKSIQKLTWSIVNTADNISMVTSEDDGYTVEFTSNYNQYANSIRSNKIQLTAGQKINVAINSMNGTGSTFISYISLINTSGSVAKQTDISYDTRATHAITIPSTGTYQIALNASLYLSSSYHPADAVATITIK